MSRAVTELLSDKVIRIFHANVGSWESTTNQQRLTEQLYSGPFLVLRAPLDREENARGPLLAFTVVTPQAGHP